MTEKITQIHEITMEMKDFKVTRLEIIINYNRYDILHSQGDKPITLTQAQKLIKDRLNQLLKETLQ